MVGSPCSPRDSQEFSPRPTVQKHQFFGAQFSLLSNSHIHTWLHTWLLHTHMTSRQYISYIISIHDLYNIHTWLHMWLLHTYMTSRQYIPKTVHIDNCYHPDYCSGYNLICFQRQHDITIDSCSYFTNFASNDGHIILSLPSEFKEDQKFFWVPPDIINPS